MENDNVCAVGKVGSPTEEGLLLQHIIHEKENCILENELSLGKEDIYKDLRVMGYDYSGEFQRLKKIRTNDFKEVHGICEWNGNVITFVDSLFQSMAFAVPLRKPVVPVMIRRIKIDPKLLFEKLNSINSKVKVQTSDNLNEEELKILVKDFGVEVEKEIFDEVLDGLETFKENKTKRFCFFKCDLPLYFNAESKLLITHGIEVEDVMAFPIPRKIETANLVLDSYEFIANEDYNAIEECDRRDIIDYIEVREGECYSGSPLKISS